MLKESHKKAFSLIELSIVLVIISVLIAGTLSVSVTGINNAKLKVTRERMDAIYKALGNYLAMHYSLPCPASLYETKSSDGYGVAIGGDADCHTGSGDGVVVSNINDGVAYGAVPVQTLGLSDEMGEDGFGSKFAYLVTVQMTRADYPDTGTVGFSFYPTTGSDTINVLNIATDNAVEQNIVAIVSFGPNKYGAFNANSSTQNGGSSDSDEVQNYPTNIVHGSPNTADFGQNDYDETGIVLTVTDPTSDVFDDILLFKTKSQIVNDFGLQFLIPCVAFASGVHTYGATYSGMLQYSTTNCTDPDDARPSYRCTQNGWVLVDSCVVY